MKLSFVIPAYNEESYIGECLESIMKEIQGRNFDVEIIVVNNASSDRTEEIARSFSRVKVVDEPKKGLVQARNSGFLASTGDLIANVDADTKIPKGWLKKVFEEFERNPNLAALSGPYIYYDLPLITRFFVKIFYLLGYTTYLLNHFIFEKGAMLQGGNFIVRRSALLKIGGFDTSIDFYGEDTDIARRMQKAGKVKFTFNLPMYTTGRRLKKEGVLSSGFRYSLNYLWILIFKRPFSKKYSDIRDKR
jgi:cellulose synthase/poly-beta-1,6-N-acetylglucosamine synthase-like glycosyltransferase